MAASILHCWMPPRSAQGTPVSIVPRPPYGTVGSNVTLTIEGFSERALSYNWYRKTTENSNRIVSYSTLTGVQKPTDIRERVQPRGFLFIPHLTLGDDDLYVVQIVDSRGVIAAIVRGKLPVYDGPDHIEILPSPENGEIKVQFNTSLTLECRALSYPSVHYEWQDINGSVHSGSTFMVNPTSWEQKKYTCWARNNMTNSSISKDITIHVVA